MKETIKELQQLLPQKYSTVGVTEGAPPPKTVIPPEIVNPPKFIMLNL